MVSEYFYGWKFLCMDAELTDTHTLIYKLSHMSTAVNFLNKVE